MSDFPFNTDEPLAYFITWTTYGTWLPGDERGWQEKGKGQQLPPNKFLSEMAESSMSEPAFHLCDHDRQTVEQTLDEHCAIRNWKKHASNPRTNHIHVVVTAPGYAPETVRDQFKAWCTRRLKPRHAGREHFWTEGASCRWINTEADLETAIIYTNDSQDRKDSEY